MVQIGNTCDKKRSNQEHSNFKIDPIDKTKGSHCNIVQFITIPGNNVSTPIDAVQ